MYRSHWSFLGQGRSITRTSALGTALLQVHRQTNSWVLLTAVQKQAVSWADQLKEDLPAQQHWSGHQYQRSCLKQRSWLPVQSSGLCCLSFWPPFLPYSRSCCLFWGSFCSLKQSGFRNQRRDKEIFPQPPPCVPWRAARSPGLTQQADSPQYVTVQRPNFVWKKKYNLL